MRIEAVKVRRLYLEVAHKIEKLIREEPIKPGRRLPSERELAVSFGVSRPTIREAMIALEIAGLVEIRTGSGIYVTSPVIRESAVQTIQDVGPGPFEVLSARLLIEAETAALAASKITDLQLAELEKALVELESSNSSSVEIEDADRRFHCIIAEASENSALASIISWLWNLRNRSKISHIFHDRVRKEGIHPSSAEHRRIFNAVKSRDPVRARSAMQTHLSNAIESDLEMLSNQDDK